MEKREVEKKGRQTPDNDYDLQVGKVSLHLTNQKKVYFPDDGYTKGDIVEYYNEVATYILPYLENRPQSLNRFPGGIAGSNFFQKDIDLEKSPAWLKSHKIFSDSNQKDIDYLLCNDKATLLYMVNLGCIEINPWNSTIKQPDKPDWMVIDLDPEEIDFKEVVKTAFVVKEVMDEMNLDSFCKTSGATGLHIYVPLGGRYEYETVRLFGQLIAHTVNVRLPRTTSIERSPQKRKNKVYIDFLQNSFGQTVAAPYSVRPRPGAPVSTPLEWMELNEKLTPLQFNISNTLTRLETKGDIWKPVLGKGADIHKIIKSISEKKTDEG